MSSDAKTNPCLAASASLLGAMNSLLLLLLLLTFVPVDGGGGGGGGAGGEGAGSFCSASSPLRSKYLVPLLESHAPVLSGCVSAERASDGAAVHVVRIDGARSRNVLLTVTGEESSTGCLPE